MTNQSQGRNGQWRFGTDCSEQSNASDVVVNPAVDDQHGWDHVLEFVPPQQNKLPADLRVPLITTFVQVKTTADKKPRTTVKLSNAMKAAKSPHPCFVFLYHYQKNKKPELYGRHIWKEDIAHYLKRARQSGNKPLNEKSVTITFTVADKVNCNPVDWVLAVLSTMDSLSYARDKADIVATVGYEEMTHQGTFNIGPDVSLSDIVRHEIGVLEDLPFTDLDLRDQRFGIVSENSVQTLTEGRISMRRDGKPLVVKLQAKSGDTLDFPALGWGSTVVGPEHPEFRFRVQCGNIQMIFGDSQNQNLNITIDTEGKYTFFDQLALLTLINWSEQGEVVATLQIEEGELAKVQLNGDWSDFSWAVQLWHCAKFLYDILGRERSASLKISLRDMFNSQGHLLALAKIMTSKSIRLEFADKEEVMDFNRLIGYSYGQIGEWGFAALHEIEHHVRKFEDGTHTLYFSHPIHPQKQVFKLSADELRDKIRADFRTHIKRQGYKYATFGEGDFVHWSTNFESGGSIALKIPA